MKPRPSLLRRFLLEAECLFWLFRLSFRSVGLRLYIFHDVPDRVVKVYRLQRNDPRVKSPDAETQDGAALILAAEEEWQLRLRTKRRNQKHS